ncbi:MAG: hypothetical protein ACK5LX_00875 [Oscillospiraceae bacterium]
MEQPYAFRQELLQLHKPGLRDDNFPLPNPAEFLLLSSETTILVQRSTDLLVHRAAEYLRDFLAVSMGVDVRLEHCDARPVSASGHICIALAENPGDLLDGNAPRGFRLDCGDGITVTAHDPAGALQGVFYLADQMELTRQPCIKKGTVSRSPLFSPRMIHSGYGLDLYPDAHLAQIARAGMDSILVFVKGVDETPEGYLDFRELCCRAAAWGLDVYAYSYLESRMNPEEPGAEVYYDRLYGSIFEHCPAFKGVVLVGESVEFPSRDERTTGRSYKEPSPDGLPDPRPNPGWWPCRDYPQWLDRVKKAVRKHKPGADIVFWTYNWGYIAAEHRIALIDSLPTDISLLVTFEMFEKLPKDDITATCVDYTLMFPGPGQYFLSEAEAAARRGIRLYSMVNTGGLTWDIGVIPYEPVPQHWMKRYNAVLEAQRNYGLCGLMESHHFGFYPSFISQLAKEHYTRGGEPGESYLERLAARDFGPQHSAALEAYRLFSEGISNYISTNEDQYGPFRIGPSYPLVLSKSVTLPAAEHAMFGRDICNTNYALRPTDGTPPFHRLEVERRWLCRMEDCFRKGSGIIAELAEQLPQPYRQQAERLAGLAMFISLSTRTTIHVKEWYAAKVALYAAATPLEVSSSARELKRVALAELENTEAAIPLVRADSRLGWEPSMDYMCDEAHLRWKLRQLRGVLERELPPLLSPKEAESI